MTEDVNVDSQARRASIVTALRDGVQRIDDLARLCGVSAMTIRRDLQALEEQNKIRRVRGGAIPVDAWSFEHRMGRTVAAKQTIAAKLRTMVPATGGIGMDGSTTVHQLALALGDRTPRDLTAVTTGLETFHQLTRTPGVRAYSTGGTADAHTGSLVGPLAALTARQFTLHTFFASATYMDERLGSTEFTADEAAVKQAMAGVARRTVLAVDSTKLGKHAVAKCFALEEIDFLVTELPPDAPELAEYVGKTEIL
ncbi:DeoR/GlpR family DNA-binding transcription regulator [Streptomyces sp. NPDC051064]|uniref:DeoR/GlpR family DNA-binding transcription regulator n=1 Tax=Streptomyces sp. NPDC051064 TaxID=3365641 RepID=UPI00379E0CCF